jgi:hypothetical protein
VPGSVDLDQLNAFVGEPRAATGYRSDAELIGIYDTEIFLRSRPTPFGLSIAHRSRRKYFSISAR